MAFDYEARYASLSGILQKKAQEAVNRVMPSVYRDWLVFIRQNAERLFSEAVERFYGDYSPNVYNRTHSLADLLQSESGENKLALWFDPGRMSGYRNGYKGEDGLYRDVFLRGWHGGADHGDYTTSVGFSGDMSYERSFYTPHPSPGSPYWRRPVPYYTTWGQPAATAAVSPYEDYTQRLAEYQTSQSGIYADYYRAWDMNKYKINFNI